MNHPYLRAGAVTALLLAALVPAAHGQGKSLADAAQANAPVPPTRYEPFLPMAVAPTNTSSPPDNWKALNRTVAASDSMSMTMEMEMEPKPEAAAPPAPAAGMKSMPMPQQPDPHAHHHQREGK